MRATFYEALEVPATAETPAIRSALRAILRRFWSVPRDPSGDTEEAVRFVALGAGILTNSERRDAYDVAARRGSSNNPWRVNNDGIPVGEDSNVLALPDESQRGASLEIAGQRNVNQSQVVPAVEALTAPLPDAGTWSTPYTYALWTIVAVIAFAAAYFALAPWFGAGVAIGISLALFVVGLAIATQIVTQTRELSGIALSRLAVTKWRRETSVFVGDPPPQQDTAWIFRLRVMELTRSAAGYSSARHLGHRVLARLADYALIAAFVLAALMGARALLPDVERILLWVTSPLLLPAIVVLIAIPFDAFVMSKWRTTPGKFLVGVVTAMAVTQPDGEAETRETLAWRRALAFARDAMSFGVWPLAIARLNGQLRATRINEGSWEAAGDTITLARNAPLVGRALAATLALALSLALASLWTRDASRLWGSVTKTASEVSMPAPSNQVATPSLPVSPDPAPVPPAAAPATNPSQTAPIAPVAPAPVPPKVEAPATKSVPPKAGNVAPSSEQAFQSELDKQTAAAQERRRRIEAAEKRVAAARVSGSYAGLQGVCERWTEDQPGSAEAWRCLGLARHQAGAGRDALPALRQALKLEPNDAQVEAAILRILRP
jgi:hypothetical protein